MPSSNTTDRQLQDVNDKLTDLGFPSVVMADVAKPLPSLPANTVALIRDMFVEVTRGTPTASNPVPRNGRGFFRALEPFGISALYGTRPLTVNVLDFLCSELQTLRLKKFHESQGTSVPAGSGSSEAATPSSAANAPAPDLPGASGAATSALDSTLNKLATCLKIPAPNIKAGSSAAFLRTVLAKAQGIGPTHAAGDAGDTLLNADSLESRRDVLERINQALRADYRLRRQMLLQRADITIQSFLWTDHVDEGKLAEAKAASQAMRGALEVEPVAVSIDSVLDQRQALLRSAQSRITHDVNTDHSVSHVIIAKVPDRGGRADDMRPSARDMRGGFGGGGGGGRGRGGGRSRSQSRGSGRGRGSGGGNGGSGGGGGGGGGNGGDASGRSKKKRGRKAKGKVQGGWGNGNGKGGKGQNQQQGGKQSGNWKEGGKPR